MLLSDSLLQTYIIHVLQDLRRLGRDLNKTIIVDNAQASYLFNPENAVAITSWFSERADTELLDLLPFFEDIHRVDSVFKPLSNR